MASDKPLRLLLGFRSYRSASEVTVASPSARR